MNDLDISEEEYDIKEQFKNAALDAAKTLIKASTSKTFEGAVSDGLLEAMMKTHRTEQQIFMSELYQFLVSYSAQGYDGRNEQSVKFAQKVKEIEPFFPYI